MKFVTIGEICSSRLVLGCSRIADKPLENIERLVKTAVDIGINTFDNADIYGGGSCEIKLGAAIKRLKLPRDKIVIQTKCGVCGGMYDLSYEHIIRSVNGSLSRLDTDYIDILLLHRPDTLMRPEEIARAFDELQHSGKVGIFGVSNFSARQIEFLQSYTNQILYIDQLRFGPTHSIIVDSGLNINTYASAAHNTSGEALEYCRQNAVTIQAYGIMQCTFTDETGYHYSGAFMSEHAQKKYFALNYTLGGLAQKYGVTPEAVAAAWVLHHPAGMQAVIGTTSDKHLKSYERCCDIPLTDFEWYEIYRSAGHTLP